MVNVRGTLGELVRIELGSTKIDRCISHKLVMLGLTTGSPHVSLQVSLMMTCDLLCGCLWNRGLRLRCDVLVCPRSEGRGCRSFGHGA